MAIDFNTAQGKQLIGGAIYCSVRSLIKDKNKWITIDDFINSFQENKVSLENISREEIADFLYSMFNDFGIFIIYADPNKEFVGYKLDGIFYENIEITYFEIQHKEYSKITSESPTNSK